MTSDGAAAQVGGWLGVCRGCRRPCCCCLTSSACRSGDRMVIVGRRCLLLSVICECCLRMNTYSLAKLLRATVIKASAARSRQQSFCAEGHAAQAFLVQWQALAGKITMHLHLCGKMIHYIEFICTCHSACVTSLTV